MSKHKIISSAIKNKGRINGTVKNIESRRIKVTLIIEIFNLTLSTRSGNKENIKSQRSQKVK